MKDLNVSVFTPCNKIAAFSALLSFFTSMQASY